MTALMPSPAAESVRAGSRHRARADRERRWAARLRDLALPDQQRHTMDRPAVLDGFFGFDGR